MAQQLDIHVRGLYTHPSDLADVPPGALAVADNVVIDREDVAEPRRGFNRSNSPFTNNTDVAKRLATYQNYLFAHLASNVLVYYSTQLATNTANFTGSGSWTAVSGSYSPPTGAKLKFAQASQNLYWTSSAGIYKLDAFDATPKKAGAFKALDCQASITSVTGNWLAANNRVAYRVVWGYTDANQNLVLGTPSQRESITNTSGSTAAVSLTITIPTGVTTSWFYQVYRSTATDNSQQFIEPSDELALVYEANPSSDDIAANQTSFTDITPDSLRGAALYTNPSQQGIGQSNDQAPMAYDIAVFRNVMFYGNTTSKNRFFLNLLAAGGTNGVSAGDTITIGGVTYTAKTSVSASGTLTSSSTLVTSITTTGLEVGDSISGTGITVGTTIAAIGSDTITLSVAATASGAQTLTFSENMSTRKFVVDTSDSDSVAQQVANTAISLVRVINRCGTSTVYAYYLSGPTDLPGQMLLEEISIGGSTFYVTCSRPTSWSPTIPTSGTTAASTNDRYLNGLYYSKTSQPEAVPIANYFFAGSADKKILRILPLRDSLFILKEDGIFRLSGLDVTTFRVDPFDATTHLLAPDTAVVMNNQIFALTDQGVVSISEAGVQVRSRPIEYDLLSLQGQNYSVLQSESFGISYETERKYILFVPTLAADTTPTQAYVFNVFTNTWTRWPLTKSSGLVNTGDDKLYLGDVATPYVNQERKSFSYQDYVDYGFPATISAVSGTTVTISNTDNISVGDVIYQSASAYSTVASVNPQAGTIDTTVSVSFTAGSADVLKAISSTITWVPLTTDNPGMLKQFRELTVLFKSDFTGNGTLVFTSDASPSQETETLVGTSIGTWGLFAWGSVNWGGTNNRRPIRVYVPLNKQRCSQLTISFQQSTGYAKYQLNGISLIANVLSERVAY